MAIRVGDRYRLEERIGAGAMGAVWRATDELLNRTVAVKELLAASAPHTAAGGDALEESRQRILREGRIGARLRHPHVISMFDVVVHEDRPWLVMEYLPSKSLAGLLGERAALPPAEAAAIGKQVADGLAAAHSAGVVHRDVKPGNVLISDEGLVKLTDFGVSRAVDEVQLTRTGLIAGTPAFLSPEVARGQEPTAASDVFALGSTLYTAVEGRPPFGLDDNAYALLHKVATGEVQPPARAGSLTSVLMWLLSPDPADRPTATQARDALATVADGHSVPVPDAAGTVSGPPVADPAPAPATVAALPRPQPATPSTKRRRPGPLVAAGLVLVALVAGISAVLLTRGGAADPGATPVAAPPAATSTAAPATAASTSVAPASSAAPSPSPSPTPEPSASAAPTAAPVAAGTDPAAFVQSYYALLPGNTEAAFAQLGSGAQAASGGRAGFERFYGGMESVSLQNLRRTGDNTAEATVVFVRRGGGTSSEPYRFVMSTGPDGRMIMESFSRA
jgi:eukaryotic-like serine/threonine-protein kinase